MRNLAIADLTLSADEKNLFHQELTEHVYVPEQETVKLTALDELELPFALRRADHLYLLAR